MANKHHSTHYIHRVSYSSQEKIVGVFVLSALALLVFFIFSAVKSQNIFEESFVIYGKLGTAAGLSTETIVQVSGIEVGKVSSVDITEDNRIMVTMLIFNRYHKLLRTDSRVKVSSLNASIIGKSIIEITAGSHDLDLLPAGSVIDIQESRSVEDVIFKATAVLNTIEKIVNDVSERIEAIDASKISSSINSLHLAMDNMSDISSRIKSGDGAAGMLIYDDNMKNNIRESAANLEQTTIELKQLVKALRNNTKQVPAVIENINSVVNETEKTIQATQRVWPISSAMPEADEKTKMVDPLPAND